MMLLAGWLLPGVAAAQLFSDQTAAQGVQFSHHEPVDDVMPLGAGGAWGDFNNDGHLDLYLADRVGPNKLYENLGGGAGFSDVAGPFGVDDATGEGTGALFCDYDNDGDQDLYVLNRGANVFFRNAGSDGAGGWRFVDVTAFVGAAGFGRTAAAVCGDYDNDGYLDLYVANHSYSNTGPAPGDLYNTDKLYHNEAAPNGDRRFVDVTSQLASSPSLDDSVAHSAGFFDYDNDGDQDLYVVNEDIPIVAGMTGENFLFRNDGPDGAGGWLWTEVAGDVGAAIMSHPMGLAIGDYNRDGWWDLALSDFGPNTLYQNVSGNFTNVAVQAMVDRPTTPLGQTQVGWGLTFFDADLDGWEDLYVATGRLCDDGCDTQPNPLFLGNGDPPDPTFTSLEETSGADDPYRSRTVIKGDYDNDGDVDLYVVNLNGEGHLFRNDQSGGDYLSFDVIGNLSNRDSLGTRVTLGVAGEPDQHRMVQSGSTTGGGHDRRVHFGVSGLTTVDSVRFEWPSGQEFTLFDVAVNQSFEVYEPVPAAWNSYGQGTACTLGVPQLEAGSNPVIGTTVPISIGNSSGIPTHGVLLMGRQAVDVPGFWGGSQLVIPVRAIPVSIGPGGAVVNVPIRDSNSLSGHKRFFQALQVDAGAANGVCSTPGLELTLGY